MAGRVAAPFPLEVRAPEALAHPYLVLDVFAAEPLEGNQLAVFLDGRAIDEDLLQPIALELNLAETVFVLPPRAGGDVRLRIFTPKQELPFAGHPVIGAAVAVAAALGRQSVLLETGHEAVTVVVERGDSRGGFARFTQAAPRPAAYEPTTELLRALRLDHSLLPIEVYENGPRHVYVALDDPAAVAAVRPDFEALAQRDIAANVFARAGRRFKTRMFAPALGIREDAATGSAAGPLALHLARHGWAGFGEDVEIDQGAEIGRPSVLYACAYGTPEDATEIGLAGSALVVAQGSFYLD